MPAAPLTPPGSPATNRLASAPLLAGPARGLTQMELMIAMVVLAILTAVAIPTYKDTLRKGRRADAMSALTQVMQAQERYRANNAAYFSGALTGLPGAPANARSVDGHYDLSIAEGTATGQSYTAVATARSDSPQAADSACLTLRVVISGGSPPTYGSTSGSGNNAQPDPCWIR